MRAAVLRNGRFEVDAFPDPVPEKGQVLVQVKACGICGSDLHFAQHGAELFATFDEMRGAPPIGGAARPDLGADIFMGHEFAAEVLEAGPDTESLPPGTLVTSMPGLRTKTGFEGFLYNNHVHGGYGERMLLTARMLLPVPNGLAATHAALTEPMAVGLHAVARSDIEPGTGALVLGAGPVGQSVIGALALRGIEPIVAVDYSPTRRDLATRMGAHVAIDPAAEDAFEAWDRIAGGTAIVVFEAIGVPGILGQIMRIVPANARIVVVGVCMDADSIKPVFGVAKELDIRFALAYTAQEFALALRALAEGELDVGPLITGEVPLDAIQQAFDDLGSPERHCKIVVVPDLA